MRRTTPLLAAVLLCLTGCSTTGLKNEDPAGHEACTTYLVNAEEDLSDDDILVYVLGSNSLAAEHAMDSTTDAIRAAAEDASFPEHNLYIADAAALVAACQDNGYEVAEHSPAWWAENRQ